MNTHPLGKRKNYLYRRLGKQDLLRVSSRCLECSASVSFNQWKLLRDKAASLSCLSNCPALALFSCGRLSLSTLHSPFVIHSVRNSTAMSLNSQGMGLKIDKFSESFFCFVFYLNSDKKQKRKITNHNRHNTDSTLDHSKINQTQP